MYDYVIVGAGSAGCVLARRLSEDPDIQVLLLEAGGDDRRAEVQVPAAFPRLFRTSCDWEYYTEPQPGLLSRRLYWPRGRVLGGSSALGAMVYLRGNRLDYDRWSEQGNPGWSYAEVLPYFRLGEHHVHGSSEFHGAGGPLHVTELRHVSPVTEAFVTAGEEAGLARNPDFNGAEQDGVGFFQVTQWEGRRQTAADAYLRPVLHRRNLSVITGARATRLLFHRSRAVGVEYLRDGRVERAFVSTEVLLCGGAVNSPQLLLLSGVGPADELRSHGIRVLVDLPGVGRNLQDHLVVPAVYECRQPVTLDGVESVANLSRYLLFRRGPLTSNLVEAGAFIRTDQRLPAPDLLLHLVPAFFLEHGLSRRAGHGFTLGVTLLTPLSRGRIRLRSGAPLEAPRIDPGYLAEPRDLDTLLAGVEIARELARARALSAFRGDEVHPGDATTRSGAREYIRAAAQTQYHPAGTCRMGADPFAVVDAELRVHGIEGVRVVDASVMPTLVRGGTNAPTLMLGERASDLVRGLLERWTLPQVADWCPPLRTAATPPAPRG